MSAAAERAELVARALCKSHGQDPDREIYNSVVREAKTRQWEAHLKHAWAALAAIDRLTNPAEPSEAQIEAGAKALVTFAPAWEMLSEDARQRLRSDARRVFLAMTKGGGQ